MTPDNPTFNFMTPEVPDFNFEIHWQDEVKPENIRRIETFVGERRSLGASVSLFILEEATTIVQIENPNPLYSLIGKFVMNEAIVVPYGDAARAFLNAEEVIRSGNPGDQNISIPAVEGYRRIEFDPSAKDQEVASKISEANQLVVGLALGEALKKMSPREFIDFYTDKRLEKTKDEAIKKTLQKSRERFHQLYTAAE